MTKSSMSRSSISLLPRAWLS
uniref:Uncharacterized protein n=1 Tax=Arundo donax TaxID=35708 RepID=A0A0A8ZM77_ARUDO